MARSLKDPASREKTIVRPCPAQLSLGRAWDVLLQDSLFQQGILRMGAKEWEGLSAETRWLSVFIKKGSVPSLHDSWQGCVPWATCLTCKVGPHPGHREPVCAGHTGRFTSSHLLPLLAHSTHAGWVSTPLQMREVEAHLLLSTYLLSRYYILGAGDSAMNKPGFLTGPAF